VAVLLCVSAVVADEIKGKITKVDADAHKITVTVDGKETEYMVSEDAKMPMYKDKNGNEKTMSLKNLARRVDKAGDRGVKATVKTEKKGGKDVITEIKTEGGKKGG
jgi:hypothetical protein